MTVADKHFVDTCKKILEEGMSSFNFNPKRRLLTQIENIKARITSQN